MFCKTCGMKNDDDALYCCGCGRKLDPLVNSGDSDQTVVEAYSLWKNPAPNKPKSGNRKNYIIMIACGVLMLGILVMLFFPVYGPWSEWKADASPAEDGWETEAKTQYRYRDSKQVQTTEPQSPEGGELIYQEETFSEYGPWSDWQTKEVTASDLCEVQMEYHYRFRTITTTEKLSDWGPWSDWSKTKATESETIQVESRKIYAYPVYGYHCMACGKAYSNLSIETIMHASKEGFDPVLLADYIYNERGDEATALRQANVSYQSTVLESVGKPLPGADGGPITYEGKTWYARSEPPYEYMQYRTRSRSLETEKTYSEWSAYSTQAVEANETTEVEALWRCRYRTREVATVYVYQTWDAWSPWQERAVSPSDTRQVEEKTLYRRRETYTLLEYLLK